MSAAKSVREGITYAGYSPKSGPHDFLPGFTRLLEKGGMFYRDGSGALGLCYVAAGRIDVYFATSVKIWDIAAGCLLVREAGGALSQLDGTPLDLENPRFAASATPELHEQVLRTLDGA